MSNPWLDRHILGFAHQGGALEGPSSTLFAMSAAVEAGATALELDVHATLDRQLVVCHDPTVDRTTNRRGAIAEMTLAELKVLDNAYYFVPGKDATAGCNDEDYLYRGRAPTDQRFGIATIEDVLDAFPGVLLNLDIKKTAPEVAPYEELLAQTLRRYGRADDVIVTSFNDHSVNLFSSFAPEVNTAPGTNALIEFAQAVRTGSPPPDSLHRRVAVQVPAWFAGNWVVDEALLNLAHGLELAVHVWTVDDDDDMERLVKLGVDGIITNRPSRLSEVLDQYGTGYSTE